MRSRLQYGLKLLRDSNAYPGWRNMELEEAPGKQQVTGMRKDIRQSNSVFSNLGVYQTHLESKLWFYRSPNSPR